MLTVNLEHVEGAQLTSTVTMYMDESRLQGPLETERWVLLGLLAEQLNMVLENHRRTHPDR